MTFTRTIAALLKTPIVLALLVVIVTNTVILFHLPAFDKPTHAVGVPSAKHPSPEPVLIVLGAGVYRKELSGMLRCRMLKAFDLYARQRATRILLSGDGTDPHYNETSAMRRFALQNGIPAESLLSDPLGFSTYDSLRRAIEVFGIQNGEIVSQNFHLRRALWLAESFGMNVHGTACDNAGSSFFYDLREVPARSKDVLLRWFDFAPRSSRDELF